MIKYISIVLLAIAFLTSCGSSKKRITNRLPKKITTSKKNEISKGTTPISRIINDAQTYEGTRYQFGGTTKKGMDCSGLVYAAFQKENIALPRTSRSMAREGHRVKLHQVQKGDLLFFKTNRNKGVINHVGLVVAVNSSRILFLHATSSKGVITSNLNESYWKKAFAEARRLL